MKKPREIQLTQEQLTEFNASKELARYCTEHFDNPGRAISALTCIMMEYIKTADNPVGVLRKVVTFMPTMLEIPNLFIGKHKEKS